jgi:translocation and assembly module TamB
VSDQQVSRGRRWTWRRIVLTASAALVALVLALFLAAVLILPSSWFREKVRDRIVYEVERLTGGRVEIGEYRFDWGSLTAELKPFVLHGTEPPGEKPLFRTESLKVQITIVSLMKRDVDLAQVVIDRPSINILFDENGLANFPRPKTQRRNGKHPVEHLVNLAIREIGVLNGELRYGDERVPLELRGQNLNAKLHYELLREAYGGEVTVEQMHLQTKYLQPFSFGLRSQVTLLRDKLEVHDARTTMRDAFVQAAGEVENFREPRLRLSVDANGPLATIDQIISIPIQKTGQAQFAGTVTYSKQNRWQVAGRAAGQHLSIRQDRISIDGISMVADLAWAGDDVQVKNTTVHALEGKFTGSAQIRADQSYSVNGAVAGVSLAAVFEGAGLSGTELAGVLSGPVEVNGSFNSPLRSLRASGELNIAASSGGLPVGGIVRALYLGAGNTLRLSESLITLPSSRVSLNGTLGERITVQAETGDFGDVEKIAGAFLGQRSLPVALETGGRAAFQGEITGVLEQPVITGTVEAQRARVQNERIDAFRADMELTSSMIRATNVRVRQKEALAAGSVDLALEGWKTAPTLPLSAKVRVQNASLAELVRTAGQKLPVEGTLDAAATITGSVGDPQATVHFAVERPTLYGETLDSARGEIRYTGQGVEVINGVLEQGKAQVEITGTYRHPPGIWDTGTLQLTASTESLPLQQVKQIAARKPQVTGVLAGRTTTTIQVVKGRIDPQQVNGSASVKDLVVDGRTLGDFDLQGKTQAGHLELSFQGALRGTPVNGLAAVRLAGDYPVTGQIEIAPVRIAALRDLVLAARGGDAMPVEGSVAGQVAFSGPLRDLEQFRANVHIRRLEVLPGREGFTPRQREEFAVRNNGPIVLDYANHLLNVQSAHLVGRETDLRISGQMKMNGVLQSDLRIDGNLNLGALSSFNEDLTASGIANVNAAVRGTLTDPALSGRLTFQDAAFNFDGLPNGIDNAAGAILFDQQRATIEKLTAQTGGGNVAFGGFVGFGGKELTYRLQARADGVRVRYPEGVSTTVNSNLTLTGSTARSLLSGVVTVVRSGFSTQTDVGGLVSLTRQPIGTPAAPNEMLRAVQLDIRVDTVPNLQFQTSLTRDMQAEADMRLRGTLAKPIVLGRINVTQGEIQFFGTRYVINRGEIGFFNPIRIEPVVDMDLETRVRGVDVNINFAGPLNRLNVSYRSDPPLQTNEIVALLAVGRTPGSNPSLAAAQLSGSQSFLSTQGNSLLGQALAAPVSSRLQRFFGVSRLKIDPHLIGINAVPQARLTVEQQISRDVTLTYVTNLSYANQQIIRLEVDLSQDWSVVALREENGVFGVDFFFRKRFR